MVAAVFFSPTVKADELALQDLEQGLTQLVYHLSRSVVTVESSTRISGTNSSGEEAVQNLVSSGIIYDTLGHILVEASSVLNRDRVTIRFENHVISAKLIGVDYQTGLALMEVNQRFGEPVNFDSDYGCAGRMVVAVGNSYGLSSVPSIGFCAGSRPDGRMQFSMPVTSGTIGGGLFDLAGRLVGIITGGIGRGNFSEAGLAVPAQKIPAMVEHLLKEGSRQAGYVGITTTEIEILPGVRITPEVMFAGAGVSAGFTIDRALLVSRVVAGSPAYKSGLREGDVIFSLDGRRLVSAVDMMNLVRQTGPGTVYSLGVLRQGKPIFVTLKVGMREFENFKSENLAPSGAANSRRAADSLQQEIDKLKDVIKRLEAGVKSLK